MKVTGIGGVFFKAKDAPMMNKWYAEKLGIAMHDWGSVFIWKDDPEGSTSFSIFKNESEYYEGNFMINFRVSDLQGLLERLKKDGINAIGIEENELGKFAWIRDPEENRIELWEPIDPAISGQDLTDNPF